MYHVQRQMNSILRQTFQREVISIHVGQCIAEVSNHVLLKVRVNAIVSARVLCHFLCKGWVVCLLSKLVFYSGKIQINLGPKICVLFYAGRMSNDQTRMIKPGKIRSLYTNSIQPEAIYNYYKWDFSGYIKGGVIIQRKKYDKGMLTYIIVITIINDSSTLWYLIDE